MCIENYNEDIDMDYAPNYPIANNSPDEFIEIPAEILVTTYMHSFECCCDECVCLTQDPIRAKFLVFSKIFYILDSEKYYYEYINIMQNLSLHFHGESNHCNDYEFYEIIKKYGDVVVPAAKELIPYLRGQFAEQVCSA